MRTLSEKDMSTPQTAQRKLSQTLGGTKDFTQVSVSLLLDGFLRSSFMLKLMAQGLLCSV